MLTRCLLIALAGAAGALTRFGVIALTRRFVSGDFPWGTLVANALACGLAGFLWALSENRISLSDNARAMIFVGFLGAFSTFSTLILETGEMVREARWLWLCGNLALHNTLGFLALYLGMTLGRGL